MRKTFARLPLAALVLSATFGAVLSPAARACTTPVFRYAMERWAPAKYEAVVFHRGPLTPAQAASVAALSPGEQSPANVVVTEVDLAAADPTADALWKRQKGATSPWLVVRMPEATADDAPLYAGPPDGPVVKELIDSPARRELSKRLLGGDSAVWVLVESGDPDRDAEAARLLDDRLAALQKELRLPDRGDPDDAEVLPSSRLLSSVPLALRFSVLRIPPRAKGEARFVGMLRRMATPEPGAKAGAPAGPLIVPVFGQGRALCVLAGKEFDAAVIGDCAAFLVGACSCQVKELNPGVDLLIAADWEAFLREDEQGPASRPATDRARDAGLEIPDPVIAPGPAKGVPPAGNVPAGRQAATPR